MNGEIVGMHRDLNKYDNARGARVTDALLGYETVKYFSNERLERDRYESCPCHCTIIMVIKGIHGPTHTWRHTCANTHLHAHTHTPMGTYTHTHTHTHTHRKRGRERETPREREERQRDLTPMGQRPIHRVLKHAMGLHRFAEAIRDYLGVDFKLTSSLCALNVVQSIIIFAGLMSGLMVCVKVGLYLVTLGNTGSSTKACAG
jgi:hypothetical protein